MLRIGKAPRAATAWYVSYRAGNLTVMHVLRSRELAIEVACRFFDLGRHDALEVGPMLGPLEENVLDHGAIQRIHETWTTKTGTQPYGCRTALK